MEKIEPETPVLNRTPTPEKTPGFSLRWYSEQSIGTKLKFIIGNQIVFNLIGLAITLYALGGLNSGLATINDPQVATVLNFIAQTEWIVFIFIGCAVIASVYAMRRAVLDVTKDLTIITKSMNDLAAGRQEIEFSGLGRHDEIGELARSLEIFQRASIRITKLRTENEQARLEKIDRMERERRGEESQRAERQQFLLGLAEQFERTVGEVVSGVSSASSQLKSTAGTMASAAEQSSTQSNVVSKYMSEASTGVTAAAAASDEFAMSISEISRQAASSAELARNASDSAQKADSTISNLSISAEEVGNIVELIQSIAKRTNLLALNASIEAARGGEAGRGFAVVASEVKELAAQTSRATEEVAAKIQAMRSSTTDSVDALRTIGAQIEQLESTAISIASAVDQQSVAGQDLARSIDLAARSTDEVSVSIAEVRETALATGAAASQVLTSATELESQSTNLHDQVGDFLRHVREGSKA